MAKGSYDISGMRSSASKITTAMDTYRTNREKINSVVEETTQYWEDPINKDYVEKFQNLKQDMESVQNLMNAYAEYLTQAAKVIERSQFKASAVKFDEFKETMDAYGKYLQEEADRQEDREKRLQSVAQSIPKL